MDASVDVAFDVFVGALDTSVDTVDTSMDMHFTNTSTALDTSADALYVSMDVALDAYLGQSLCICTLSPL